jgi:predicted nucleic acid-binding protein
MKTAIDSSVLLAIFNEEPGAEKWLDTLVNARREGNLVVCEVVFSELVPAFQSQPEFEDVLGRLGARFDPIAPEASWLAGRTFMEYRDAGGPREHMIPDFLIAAHARLQADRLAAIDRGYIRRYFRDLPLVEASWT